MPVDIDFKPWRNPHGRGLLDSVRALWTPGISISQLQAKCQDMGLSVSRTIVVMARQSMNEKAAAPTETKPCDYRAIARQLRWEAAGGVDGFATAEDTVFPTAGDEYENDGGA